MPACASIIACALHIATPKLLELGLLLTSGIRTRLPAAALFAGLRADAFNYVITRKGLEPLTRLAHCIFC